MKRRITRNRKIGSNRIRIFAGLTWGEAIRHAANREEPDTWIEKCEEWCSAEYYKLKTHGIYRKGRSLTVPRVLNDYVEYIILHNYRNKRLKDLGCDNSYIVKIDF